MRLLVLILRLAAVSYNNAGFISCLWAARCLLQFEALISLKLSASSAKCQKEWLSWGVSQSDATVSAVSLILEPTPQKCLKEGVIYSVNSYSYVLSSLLE